MRLPRVTSYLPRSTCMITGSHPTSLVTKYFPPQPLSGEAEDLPGGRYELKDVTRSTYLKYYLIGFIYVLRTAREHYINLSMVLNPSFNSPIC